MKRGATLKRVVRLNSTEAVAFINSLTEAQAKNLLHMVIQTLTF